MNGPKSQAAFMFGAIVMGIASLVFSVTGAIFGDMSAADKLVWGLVLGVGGIMILVGLRQCSRTPPLGGALIVLGAVALGVMMWWSLFVPVLAVLLAAYGVTRARQFARERSAVT